MKTAEIPGGFIVPDDQCIGRWQREVGLLAHDAFLVPIACANIPPGGIVIDCGAFDGDHTIAYARKVGKDGTVIAIEAGKVAFRCLKHNAEKFESPVVCINAAVWDLHGFSMEHTINEDNVGASTVHQPEGLINDDNRVPTVSIDGIMKDGDVPFVNFIKIDCEGSEMKILRGAEQTLRDHKPILMIEINRGVLENHGTSDKDIYEFLLGLNYEWRIIQENCKGGDDQFDILCWRKAPGEMTAR